MLTALITSTTFANVCIHDDFIWK